MSSYGHIENQTGKPLPAESPQSQSQELKALQNLTLVCPWPALKADCHPFEWSSCCRSEKLGQNHDGDVIENQHLLSASGRPRTSMKKPRTGCCETFWARCGRWVPLISGSAAVLVCFLTEIIVVQMEKGLYKSRHHPGRFYYHSISSYLDDAYIVAIPGFVIVIGLVFFAMLARHPAVF
eukprot:g1403.t1